MFDTMGMQDKWNVAVTYVKSEHERKQPPNPTEEVIRVCAPKIVHIKPFAAHTNMTTLGYTMVY